MGRRRLPRTRCVPLHVCTENSVRVDYVTESPNVSGDDRSLMLLPDPVRLAVWGSATPKAGEQAPAESQLTPVALTMRPAGLLLDKLIHYDPARAMAFIAIDEQSHKMLGVVRLAR